jgi:hypothetical protein
VQLLGVPVRIWADASERYHELLREFTLVQLAGADAGVPGQLLELSGELTARFAGLVAASTARLESAVAAGLDVVDVTHRVPPELADGCRRLLDLLDEADDYCRSGQLLTVTSSPIEVEFRRWYLGQFVAQVDGESPQRWDGPLA